MSAYLQMGHHSRNLVGEEGLEKFKGIILSPVNRESSELSSDIKDFRKKKDYDIVFDPQLYFPRSEKGKLQTYNYYPDDLDTADLSSQKWWYGVNRSLKTGLTSYGFNKIASPALKAKKIESDYYQLVVDVSNHLHSEFESEQSIETMTSVYIDPSKLDDDSIKIISSILSKAESKKYYLIIDYGKKPRREVDESVDILNSLKFLFQLQKVSDQILISHTSAEMILYKYIGIDSCATGKFFNLRRFTPSRFEESEGGGGQLPYWFEHSLLTFLREADILRLKERDHGHLLKTLFSDNFWAKKIYDMLTDKGGEAWLAWSWRQYLSWFSKTEEYLSNEDQNHLVLEWLEIAETNWENLKGDKLLFDETKNNGKWIRKWRNALLDFDDLKKKGML